MKKRVFVLGNPLETLDQSAVNLIPKLKKSFPNIDFVHFDPTEELTPDITYEELTIIDTVVGLKRVTEFNDSHFWSLSPRVTVHDYDLPLFLGILKKLGKIKKLTIIGIPQIGVKEENIKEIKNILKDL